MSFNPQIHQRKSIRLKDYDYSKSGAYFITVCSHERETYFEKYPELIKTVNQEWQGLIKRYSNIILDEFVIMPNHLHGIIVINESLGDNSKKIENVDNCKRANVTKRADARLNGIKLRKNRDVKR